MKPERRVDGLVVKELQGEVLVYDLERHQAHCLNPAAAFVFRRADGKTDVRELARALRDEVGAPADEAWVWLALDRLDKARLLREPVSRPPASPRITRRELVRRAGIGLALLLPAVTSVVAPTPAEAAATCVTNCTGKPFGTPCSSTAPSNCLCTCDGGVVCVGAC